MAPGDSSKAARRAMILRSSSGSGGSRHRNTDATRVGRIILRREIGHVVFGLGDDDAIDEVAGDLHVTRRQRASFGDVLDLGDHDAIRVLRAIAMARLLRVSGSFSMVISPMGSAVVPRMNATVTGATL